MSGAGQTLTIISAGDQAEVLNPYYDPAASGSSRIINRDYGFGGTKGSVSIGGTTILPANITTWTKDMIVLTVQSGVSTGQLVVTRGDNNVASTVGVTVTVGGNAPIPVPAGGSIQAVIDAPTTPDGALITIPPGIYNEYVIMDKKVRLQGWGALSTMINAAKFSTDGLKNWRTLINRKIDATPSNPPVIDPDTGQNTLNAGPLRTFDLLPGQTLGTNISNNEPLLFGAEEGPGIMVLGSATAGRQSACVRQHAECPHRWLDHHRGRCRRRHPGQRLRQLSGNQQQPGGQQLRQLWRRHPHRPYRAVGCSQHGLWRLYQLRQPERQDPQQLDLGKRQQRVWRRRRHHPRQRRRATTT